MSEDTELVVIDLDSPGERGIIINGETGRWRDRNSPVQDEPYAGFGGVYTQPFRSDVVLVAIYAFNESLFVQIGSWRGDFLQGGFRLKYIWWVPFVCSLRVYQGESVEASVTIWKHLSADHFTSEPGRMLQYVWEHARSKDEVEKSLAHWKWTGTGRHLEPGQDISQGPEHPGR